MTDPQIGLAGFLVLGLLIYSGMHISTALLSVTFFGVWILREDPGIASQLIGLAATDAVAEYEFGTVPLFVLMGFFVMVAGVGADSYRVAHKLLKHVPGGLGHATVVGNAIFSAITGITAEYRRTWLQPQVKTEPACSGEGEEPCLDLPAQFRRSSHGV